jgi:hypothetical protein
MTKALKGHFVFNALLLIIASYFSVIAQNRGWREIKGKSLVVFDFNCASTSAYPDRKLNRIVRAAVAALDTGGLRYADRAFAFDLNDDRSPEYFVPLSCGATGNCDWAVFALNPARLLGTINGQYLYVYGSAARWPTLITYGHLSAVEGSLFTYRFRKTRYLQSGTGYPINYRYGTFDLEIQGGSGHRMPRTLERARAGCRTLGY